MSKIHIFKNIGGSVRLDILQAFYPVKIEDVHYLSLTLKNRSNILVPFVNGFQADLEASHLSKSFSKYICKKLDHSKQRINKQ